MKFSPFDSAKNCKFFPPDFFVQFPKEKKKSLSLNNKDYSNSENNPKNKSSKSIIIDIQKENEEVKELIDLIDGKRNYIFL